MPCNSCNSGTYNNSTTQSRYNRTSNYSRSRYKRNEIRSQNEPEPCLTCEDLQQIDICRKPCKCKSNDVKIAPITASGSVGRGQPTIACTEDCSWYFDTCRCVLWKCNDGQWVQQEQIVGCWYFYQQCSEQIWKIQGRCNGGCKMKNIGDDHCNGDIFIDCNTYTYYVYKNCRWRPRMKDRGVNIYFSIVGDQRINIVTNQSTSSMVQNFTTIINGVQVTGKNAYYDTSTGNMFTYDEDISAWVSKKVDSSVEYLVDIWGTFYRIGTAPTVTLVNTNGYVYNNSSCCTTTCDDGLKDGDILIDDDNSSFYTWDSCQEIWVLRATFPGDLEAPNYLSIYRTDAPLLANLVIDYPSGLRGDLASGFAAGVFTVPRDGTYDLRYRYRFGIISGSALSGEVESTIVRNASTTPEILVYNTDEPAPASRSELSLNIGSGLLQTVAELNAGDTISIFTNLALDSEQSFSIESAVLIEMVRGQYISP